MEQKRIADSSVEIINRKSIKISGVERVFNSSDSSALLQTSYGRLLILGQTLQVKKISIETGIMEIDGKINSVKYVSDGFKLGLFKKWFKKQWVSFC